MKKCLFDESRICTEDCDECFKCEYDPNKTCDNCGKCLGIDGVDIRGIKVEEIAENEDESKEYTNDIIEDEYISHEPIYDDYKEGEDTWDFIDDIRELKDLVENPENLSNDFIEEFPGLIRLKNKDK